MWFLQEWQIRFRLKGPAVVKCILFSASSKDYTRDVSNDQMKQRARGTIHRRYGSARCWNIIVTCRMSAGNRSDTFDAVQLPGERVVPSFHLCMYILIKKALKPLLFKHVDEMDRGLHLCIHFSPIISCFKRMKCLMFCKYLSIPILDQT